MRLSLIMPVFNEADVLPETIERLAHLSLPVPWELIVIDDGSTDDSAAIIERSHIYAAERVVVERLTPNRGKGAAIRHGFAIATGDFLGVQDADLEYDPADIAELLPPLIEGRADAVFGSRERGRYKPYSFWYKVGNRILGLTAGVLFGRFVSDLYTGHKFFTREIYQRLKLTADGFDIEAELAAGLFMAKARIVEVPISYMARSREAGKKLRARDGLVGLVRLFRIRFGR
ncbi:MAG: glycosyltransferase family 2 protein [Candidatus Limnocylindrales bacterium]